MRKPYLKKENINSFKEENGLNILKKKLETNRRIKTYFFQNDKTPIFDGHFNYLSDDLTILKKIEVQVKSTEELVALKKGPNKGKYKYNFDVSVLNSIKYKITDNPTIYFVVDCKNEICFFKNIDKEFLVKLNYDDSKAEIPYYFQNEDIIEDINVFIKFIEGLYVKSIDSINFKSKDEIKSIQKSMNEFYKKINELYFVRDEIWPDFWKFGLRYSSNFSLSLTNPKTGVNVKSKATAFAIYPIELGSEEGEIKEYSMKDNNLFNSFDCTCEKTTDDYLNDCLSKILNYYFDSDSSLKIMPDICMDEIIFSILDTISKSNTDISGEKFFTCKYNSLSMEEVKNILRPYFETRDAIFNKNFEKPFDKVAYKFMFSPMLDINNFGLICLAEKILTESEKRNKQSFERVWDYFRKSSSSATIRYRDECFDEEIITKDIQRLFDYLIKYLSEILDKLPIKISNPLKQQYAYEFYFDDQGMIPTYVIKMAMSNKCCDASFIKGIDEKTSYEWKSTGCYFSNLFWSKTPLFNLLRIVVHHSLCKKYNVKYDGISVEHLNSSYPFYDE